MKKAINKIKLNFKLVLSVFTLLLITSAIFAQTGETINLGLYGGKATDLTYAVPTNRLFATVETPASLFYSDDNCATWTQAFPDDSLEYDSGAKGWGGGGVQVLANSVGWVGVMTSQQAGTLTAAVISYGDGDVGSFKTAMDKEYLQDLGYSYESVNSIALSDYYFYVTMGEYILRGNDTENGGVYQVVADISTISGVGKDYYVRSIAVANDSSGYPIYVVVTDVSDEGDLYEYDGTSFSFISSIPAGRYVEKIFTLPNESTGSTLFASTAETYTGVRNIYLSDDNGVSWSDKTPGIMGWPLKDVDYSPYWVTSMSSSNGVRISLPGGGVSDNLGTDWTAHVLPDNGIASDPTNPNIVVGSYEAGVAISYGGPEDVYTIADNDGFAAVRISKIANSGTIYYVSTNAGLGYTTAYFNPSVTGISRWEAPYGDFPISGVGWGSRITCVAIDPNNEDHVIAGYPGGFSVSFGGPSTFTNVIPGGWNTSTNYDADVQDIKFISSDTVIAVSGKGEGVLFYPSSPYGNVWMSIDGGLTWNIVTPSGFEQGQCLAVGKADANTVIYAGTGYMGAPGTNVDGGLWRSDDWGLNWTFVNDGPTGLKFGTTKMVIYDIDVDPRDNELIYLASGDNLDYAFVKSDDGGQNYFYTPISTEGAFSSVLINPDDPDIISCGARRDLYRYNSILDSYTLSFRGLPGEFIPDLEHGSILLGTTTGLYKLKEEPGCTSTEWIGTGNWSDHDNWTNGVPYEFSDVIIKGNEVLVDMNVEINDLNLEPGAKLKINNGDTLHILGDFYLYSDTSKQASFIDEGVLLVDGNTISERYYSGNQWHLISSPVSDAISGMFAGNYLEYHDEQSNLYEYISTLYTPLNVGQGYALWGEENNIAEFSGTLNNGYQEISLSRTYQGDTSGWNLVGNPYPCAIDWDAASGWTKTNIGNTIYFYANGSWATYNSFSGGTNGGSNFIPANQGFFVSVNNDGSTNGLLAMNNDVRVHDEGSFFKSTTNSNKLKLSLSNGTKSDETIIIFDESASIHFDSQYDAYKLLSFDADIPQIYSNIDHSLAVNVLPATKSIPIEVKGKENQNLCIGIQEEIGFENVYLEDVKTGNITNLKESDYCFKHDSDYNQRFILHFEALSVEKTENSIANVFAQNKNIIIKTSANNESEIQIFNGLGQVIHTQKINSTSTNIPIEMSGVYFVKIQHENEWMIKKIIIK